jgi:hypothetical protein
MSGESTSELTWALTAVRQKQVCRRIIGHFLRFFHAFSCFFAFFLEETKKKCNKFADLGHIVTGTGTVVGNFCRGFWEGWKITESGGFAVDYRSDFGYNTTTFRSLYL